MTRMNDPGPHRPRRARFSADMAAPQYNLYVQQHMGEETWQHQVIGMAHDAGWLVLHINKSLLYTKKQHSPSWMTAVSVDALGWPDIVMFKGMSGVTKMIAWELKAWGNKPTAAQNFWLDLLGRVPGCVEAKVRYPWEVEEMMEKLWGEW